MRQDQDLDLVVFLEVLVLERLESVHLCHVSVTQLLHVLLHAEEVILRQALRDFSMHGTGQIWTEASW